MESMKVKKDNIEKIIEIRWNSNADDEWKNGGFLKKAKLSLTSSPFVRIQRDADNHKKNASDNLRFLICEILQKNMYCKRGATEVDRETKHITIGHYEYSVPYCIRTKVTISKKNENFYNKIMNLSEVQKLLSEEHFSEEDYKNILKKINEQIKRK